MNSLVSVIMPYYNKKNYFLKSINSALKQTYTNLEILIIYDDHNRNDLEYIKISKELGSGIISMPLIIEIKFKGILFNLKKI